MNSPDWIHTVIIWLECRNPSQPDKVIPTGTTLQTKQAKLPVLKVENQINLEMKRTKQNDKYESIGKRIYTQRALVNQNHVNRIGKVTK